MVHERISPLRPHRFGEAGCIWCGVARDTVEDALAPAECAAHDPVQRTLIENAEKLAAEIKSLGYEADHYLRELTRRQSDQKVLIDQLFAINTALGRNTDLGFVKRDALETI